MLGGQGQGHRRFPARPGEPCSATNGHHHGADKQPLDRRSQGRQQQKHQSEASESRPANECGCVLLEGNSGCDGTDGGKAGDEGETANGNGESTIPPDWLGKLWSGNGAGDRA